ncbi:MAG: alkaline phosphatase [Gammaproteobacteria bacterium]|nr:alkaline phosphatase [Gammaproteobacteria bacterium]
MNRFRLLAALALLVQAASCDRGTSGPAAEPAAPRVILFIGDGMDDQQITIARNYLVGSRGRLVLDAMPYRGAAQVLTVDEADPRIPVYVGDSASGGTALATGTATSIGRVSTAAGTDQKLASVMELASAAGFATGVVSSTSITDATPAAFVAHIDQRYCQGPSSMELVDKTHPQYSTNCSKDYKSRGGRGSVAEQIAESGLDLILGGGLRDFDQPVEQGSGTTVLDLARQNGFSIIRNRSDLASIRGQDRTIGLFSDGIMPVKLRGSGGAIAEFVQREDGRVLWPEPFACEDNPEFADVPTLAEMTGAALRRLDGPRGFVLMVESASIDDQAHYWRTCGHIGEVGQLDEALALALDYAATHPETLILVTADHGHAAQLIPETSELAPQEHASPGRFARIRTPEGGIMGVNYSTNDSPDWEEHSGVQVPVYAAGPGVRALPPFMHQVDVFGIMLKHLGLGTGTAGTH